MVSPFLIGVMVVIVSVPMLFILLELSEEIQAEFVESRRHDAQRLRGRRIRKVTAKELVSAGLPPGVVVFATHSMGEEVWKCDVFLLRVPEDFGQCYFSKGMRFYRGTAERIPIEPSKGPSVRL
jgi:hypothetical protein